MMKDIDTFIKEHNHICYCEAIIHPNGEIEEAIPSHTEALIRISGIPKEEIYDLIPIEASPIHWLVGFTGCTAIWYEYILEPLNITDNQKIAIEKLIEKEIIKPKRRY